MSPRPRFTSRLTRARNAALGVVLRPFRLFSPATQLVLGFTFMVVATTLAGEVEDEAPPRKN